MFEQYIHHGNVVWVKRSLKGKHRESCLCFSCDKFIPEFREKNCPAANELYEFDVKHSMTTPVFECMDFSEKK